MGTVVSIFTKFLASKGTGKSIKKESTKEVKLSPEDRAHLRKIFME